MDSNPRPTDYKSAVLPTELHQQNELINPFVDYNIADRDEFVKGFLKNFLKNFW